MKSVNPSSRMTWAILILFGGIVFVAAQLTVTPAKSQTESGKSTKKSAKRVPLWDGKADYVGDEICLGCHAEVAENWKKTRHGQTLSHAGLSKEMRTCETCHGPGSEHASDDNHKKVFNPASMPSDKVIKQCLPCHSSTAKSLEWAASAHGQNDVSCNKCHDIHKPTTKNSLLKQNPTELCLSCHKKQNAEFRSNTHHPVLEGRVKCTDCHNPHKPDRVGRGLKGTGDNPCLKCHTEVKGPFRVEHDPNVSGLSDGCTTCHKPHGSPNPKLLKLFGRGLCLQCHTDRATHRVSGGTCWNVGCHSEVHGGNRALLLQG